MPKLLHRNLLELPASTSHGLLPAIFAAWLSLFCIPAPAAIQISQVEIDGTPHTVEASANQFNISSQAKSAKFHFTESNEEGQPTARLRYKLDGYDNTWRDLDQEHGMKLLLQFWDSALSNKQEVVGSDAFYLQGETPGWRGTVEQSDFTNRSGAVIAPGRTASVKVVLLSLGYSPGIGLIALDNVRLHVEHPEEKGRADNYDLAVTQGAGMNDPMGCPSNWARQGSQAEMAQLRIRPSPIPHPVLIIDDNSPRLFANWVTKEAFQAHHGDRVTLEWQTAHSVGCCGPGQADYPQLKPGHYLFRVAMAKSNGELTGTDVSLPIDVIAPLYHRPEFWLVLSALLSILVIWTSQKVIQQRMRKQLAELEREHAMDRERERIARDLHDDIGAGLTEIAMQSAWVKRDLERGPTGDTQRRIERICQASTELARSVDEIVWAVNPANDTVDRFANYLIQNTSQLLDAAGVRVRFHTPAEFPILPLDGKVRHFLFLAVREALNNVIKHAKADMVRLTIATTTGELHITVDDNGCGFSPGQEESDGTREGLTGMRQRLSEIGGQFYLDSRPSSGTRVEFVTPLNNSLKEHHD